MTVEILKNKLNALSDDLKSFGVVSLRVFGSVAKEQNTEKSDIDLIVEFDDRPIGLFEFIALKHFLEKNLKSKIDLVTVGALKEQRKDQILVEAIRVS